MTRRPGVPRCGTAPPVEDAPPPHRSRGIIALSGGVDSSTAAALLLEQGCDLIGVTLKLRPDEPQHGPPAPGVAGHGRGSQAAADAAAVCKRLGIPFHLVDASAEFRARVIRYFADEYTAGRTPNPCVVCNETIKFGLLLDRARDLGAEWLATGHYARHDVDPASGRHRLKRGRDPRRDQSYFLFSLRQQQLARVVFPLGDHLKTETRALARRLALETADKADSMEVCFVPGNDYGRFLRETGLVTAHPGEIVDVAGHVLGRHEGIAFFTIGQRRGLRVPASEPLYVVDLDPLRNRVIVGKPDDLGCHRFRIERCNWIAYETPPPLLEVVAKIRFNHPGTRAAVKPGAHATAEVELEMPQRAVTPGQACVFYQDNVVVGGGWIVRHSPGTGNGRAPDPCQPRDAEIP